MFDIKVQFGNYDYFFLGYMSDISKMSTVSGLLPILGMTRERLQAPGTICHEVERICV